MNMHQPRDGTRFSTKLYLSDKADGYMRLIPPEQYFKSETMLDAARAIVAKYEGVKLPVILGDSRSKWIVEIRMEMVVYFRDILGKSYPQIGRFLRRDHTSVISLYRKHQRRLIESQTQ